MTAARIKKYFKNILLEKHEIRCFIDFGSQCSLITENLATSLGLPRVPLMTPVILTTLGDKHIKPEAMIRAGIELDGICKIIQFYVVKKCVMNVEVLIGQNFTELDDIQFYKTGSLLQFSLICVNKQLVNSINSISREHRHY